MSRARGLGGNTSGPGITEGLQARPLPPKQLPALRVACCSTGGESGTQATEAPCGKTRIGHISEEEPEAQPGTLVCRERGEAGSSSAYTLAFAGLCALYAQECPLGAHLTSGQRRPPRTGGGVRELGDSGDSLGKAASRPRQAGTLGAEARVRQVSLCGVEGEERA